MIMTDSVLIRYPGFRCEKTFIEQIAALVPGTQVGASPDHMAGV